MFDAVVIAVCSLVWGSMQDCFIRAGSYLNLLKDFWIILFKNFWVQHLLEWRRIEISLEVLRDDNASGTHKLCRYFSVLKAHDSTKHLFLSYLLTESMLFEANYLELASQNQAFLFIVKFSSYLWLTSSILLEEWKKFLNHCILS